MGREVFKTAVDIGVSVGIVMATVGIGNTFIRLWASKKLAQDPNNVTASAVLIAW